jgi:hypothetical protein
MEMAKYIYAVLKSQINIMWSWGFNTPRSLPNEQGLIFKVQGFKHKGFVAVVFNAGADLFEVILYDHQMNLKSKTEGVYFDMLVDVIDGLVERTTDYEDRVKDEYAYMF